MDPSVEALLEEAEREAQQKARHQARKEGGVKNGNKLREDGRPPRHRDAGGYGYGEPEEAPEPEPTPRPPRTNTPPEYIALAPTSADGKQRSASNTNTNTNRYSVEREENDKRRSRRSHDLDTDERRNSSDKGSANGSGSVRSDRRRSRSPARPRRDSRDRGNEHRSRDYRDRRDGRDRPPSGDYYTGNGRAPAYDDDRYRPGRDEPPRRDTRSPPRYFDRPRGGGRPRSPDRRRNKTPEPTDDERDRRTVFVQQLAARLRTKELKTFFEQVGPVVEAQIVKDRISQRSKGVGYVEFAQEESVQKAIGLTGQKLLGIPIIAQLTEAEKNRQARTTEGTATQSNGIPFHRLYVGNIHFSIHEDDLKNIFEPFGELEFVQLQKEEQGRSKGYGFVQFIDPTQAKEALEKMNGFELAGRPIRVGLGNDKFTPESTQKLLHGFSHQNQNQNQQGSSFSGMGGRGAHAGGTANFDRASGRDADRTGGASALDDTDVTGVNFSNFSRDSLMRKLARIDEPEQKVAPKTQTQSKTQVEEPAPSRCVLIKHMFDPTEETEPGWQKELERDVREECEDKYGHVVHIGVGMESNEGEVYVKFDRTLGGTNAVRGLNGRWFGGRILAAQYVVEAVYNINFPKAANV